MLKRKMNSSNNDLFKKKQKNNNNLPNFIRISFDETKFNNYSIDELKNINNEIDEIILIIINYKQRIQNILSLYS